MEITTNAGSAAPTPATNVISKQQQSAVIKAMSKADQAAVSAMTINMHQTADRITEFDANVDGPTTMEWIDEVNANLQFYIDVGVPKTAIISAIRRRMTGEVKQVVGYRKFEHLSHLGILLMEAFPQERFEMRAREKLGKLSTFNELPAYMIAPIGMNLLHRAEMNDTHCILLADTLSRLDTQAWYATGISPYMATTANIESLLTTFQQHYKKQ